MRYQEIFEDSNPHFVGPTYDNYAKLKAAIQDKWGTIEIQRGKMLTRTGSRWGFTFGRQELIDSKSGAVVGFWELTDADQYPGRGTVTRGYGQVAKPPVELPKKAHPVPGEPTAPATKQEMSAAMSALLTALKSTGGYGFDVDGPYSEDSRAYMSVRHWGQWENPQGEEDEEDYDWQVMTDDSSHQLEGIIANVGVKYPNVKMECQGSEKQWLEFIATSHL